MIAIATRDLDSGPAPLTVIPSRATYALRDFIDQRERDYYPSLPGYKPAFNEGAGGFSVLEFSKAVRLPDQLRAEQWAFVTLPLAELMPGGGIQDNNIGRGRLCPVPSDLAADSMVHGVLLLSRRSEPLAMALSSIELAGISADLKGRNLCVDVDLDTQYLMARLTDEQRVEAEAFEAGKRRLGGLHFVAVQSDFEADDVAGYWLLK